MSKACTIAIDAMGGDFGPRVTVPAAIHSLIQHPNLTIQLAGDREQIQPFLNKAPRYCIERLSIIHTTEEIRMDDRPSHALRHGRGSSMSIALQQVEQGNAAACVSAGNTGALMALGRIILRTLPGIDRPAIITAVPTQAGHCYMLDLGANVDCSAEHLSQFAIMGSVLVQSVEGISSPRVGLLNIGREEIKGNEQVKLAAHLIKQHTNINYIGFIEGDALYAGEADVVVCDGFVGNIALKSSEGLARLIGQKVRSEFSKNLFSKLLALLAKPMLESLQAQIDPSRRNGASLLGLQGIVVKSHGSANRACYSYAIRQAIAEVEKDLPSRISAQLGHL